MFASSSRFTLRFLHGKEDDNFSRHFPSSRSPHNEILPALLLIRGFRKLLAPASAQPPGSGKSPSVNINIRGER